MNLKSRIKKIESKTSKTDTNIVCVLFGNETQAQGRKKMNLKDDVDIIYIRVVGVVIN